MQCLQIRILSLFLLSIVIVSVLAAPLKASIDSEEENTDTAKVESPVTGNDGEDTQANIVFPDNTLTADSETAKNIPEADDDRGQEIINYQDIQVDHNSKVTSENKGAHLGQELDEDEDGEGFEDFVEADDDDEEQTSESEEEDEEEEEEGSDEYMLTPAAARELMLELRDPMEVAKFVVESDDAAGFLRALRLLLHDGYITESQAYNLKDEVALQLKNLLMLQQVELSRALFETYEPQIEQEDVLYNQEAQPIDFYDYNNMLNQEGAPYGSMPDNLFDVYEETIEEESSQAVAEIAEILAQKIAKEEISPEEGARIMNKVIQLLPESYWGESEDGMSSSSLTSDYMMPDQTKVNDDNANIVAQLAAAQDENETDDDGDDLIDNFEEELLQEGPGGVLKEIEEEDTNGDDDAAELEEEAENLADELEAELEEGQVPLNQEAMKIERPGAKAVVKVGPSNDVTGDDMREDWKEMSLLLDQNIPEDVLRSLGISLPKPSKTEEAADQ